MKPPKNLAHRVGAEDHGFVWFAGRLFQLYAPGRAEHLQEQIAQPFRRRDGRN